MSHCGSFYYEDKYVAIMKLWKVKTNERFFFGFVLRYVKGCLQSCGDADGCNDSKQNKFDLFVLTSGILLIRIGSWYFNLR